MNARVEPVMAGHRPTTVVGKIWDHKNRRVQGTDVTFCWLLSHRDGSIKRAHWVYIEDVQRVAPVLHNGHRGYLEVVLPYWYAKERELYP